MLLKLTEEERPMWSLFYHFRTTINSAPAKRFDILDSNWEFRFVGVKIDTFLRISKDWVRRRGEKQRWTRFRRAGGPPASLGREPCNPFGIMQPSVLRTFCLFPCTPSGERAPRPPHTKTASCLRSRLHGPKRVAERTRFGRKV